MRTPQPVPKAGAQPPMPNVALTLDALGDLWRRIGGNEILCRLDRDPATLAAWHAALSSVAPHEWPDLVRCLEPLIPGLRGRRDLLSPDSPFGHGVIAESRRQALQRILASERISLLETITRPKRRQEAA
ncbi:MULTISPECIES: hypothetical protein [Acetobacteraceae]|nr:MULTISPECIES: hypothetical protein [Acetobacteraceae]GBQ70516.1 hypothetical protein AA15237_0890 [Komagataeibacter xylinus NBRC 15237]